MGGKIAKRKRCEKSGPNCHSQINILSRRFLSLLGFNGVSGPHAVFVLCASEGQEPIYFFPSLLIHTVANKFDLCYPNVKILFECLSVLF